MVSQVERQHCETERQHRTQQGIADRLQSWRAKMAYTLPELVYESGVGRSKIYQEIAAGRLKVRKLGKRTIALHDDAMSWLQSLPAA